MFEVRTSRREQLIDITREVERMIAENESARSGSQLESASSESAVLVFCPHTTAGITINENADPDVVDDILMGLSRMVPRSAGWRHAEGNSDGHVKASLVGSSVTVPMSAGRLELGTWQGVYLCEFDGPRTRRVSVTVLS